MPLVAVLLPLLCDGALRGTAGYLLVRHTVICVYRGVLAACSGVRSGSQLDNDCQDGEDGRWRTRGMLTSRERNVLFGDGSGKAVTNRGLQRQWPFTF